jgi:exopolysaccharide production protein ExoZ
LSSASPFDDARLTLFTSVFSCYGAGGEPATFTAYRSDTMIWSVQILRFIAALMVVYLHAVQIAIRVNGSIGLIPPAAANLGYAGVDIFFVISGLIIAKIAPKKIPSDFIWSRITRIVPMYFFFSVLWLAVNLATIGFSWRDALATFLFWPATDTMTAPVLPVGWSLCFEMLFYVCAWAVLLNRLCAIFFVVAYVIVLVLHVDVPLLQFVGNPIILEFLAGVAIAYTPSCRLGVMALPLGALMLVGAGVIGVAPQNPEGFSNTDAMQRVLTFGIPSAMIVYGTLQIKARESVWTYLGDASYSLYLSHMLVMLPLVAFWRKVPMPSDIIILVCIAISIPFAWRIYERFEKPILFSIKNRKLRQFITCAMWITR